MVKEVEHLHSKGKTLSSKPSTAKNKTTNWHSAMIRIKKRKKKPKWYKVRYLLEFK
jgi:hypothetical protein